MQLWQLRNKASFLKLAIDIKKTKKLSKQAALPFLEPQENTTHTGRLVHLLSDAAVGTRPGPGERGYSDEIDLRRLSLRSSELTHFMYHD